MLVREQSLPSDRLVLGYRYKLAEEDPNQGDDGLASGSGRNPGDGGRNRSELSGKTAKNWVRILILACEAEPRGDRGLTGRKDVSKQTKIRLLILIGFGLIQGGMQICINAT